MMVGAVWINRVVDHLIWVVVLLFLALVPVVIHGFFTYDNLINVLLHASVLGLLAIAGGVVLISGVFDLSLGANMGFVAYLVAWLSLGSGAIGSGWGVPPVLSALIGIAAGSVIGWINGTLVTRLRMNSFLVTLSTLIILGGLTFVLNQARTLSGLPDALLVLGGKSTIGSVPNSVILMALSFVVAFVVSRYRPSGRRLYATGSNPESARAAGIDPDRVVRRAFILAGALAAVAGLVIIGELGSAPADVGNNVIFEVFAAVVIGGVSLRGGRGSFVDVLGGVLLLSLVSNALNLTQIDPFTVEPIRGFIILLAVFLDSQREALRSVVLRLAGDRGAGTYKASAPEGAT